MLLNDTRKKLTQWEERIAGAEIPNIEATMMLADWRAERQAMIKKFQSIYAFHHEELPTYDPRSKKYYYHAVMKNFADAIVLALTSDDLSLLRGE